ncbi:probable membrane-associated kinase regulator 1 [Cornus florida]|uniref:probable membrane-associated kinase regulator 1 n=1 Tax=Cornus florida TaxID=4283 RepID=UPI00289AE713|nr:probable membrane-associated kinase regulator 1 [Cornus florida]
MENRRLKNSSGDKFSFPAMPMQGQDSEFEFGCVTPGSPNSPADHLFFNGRLLPHAFPLQPANSTKSTNYTRSMSRTSSVSSKDSLMSSRSNSTSSRSSSCSSARTSTSEASERKLVPLSLQQAKAGISRTYQANKPAALAPQYGSSQRWQFITPSPGLNRQVSRSKKPGIVSQEELRAVKNVQEKSKTRSGSGFGSRFFRSFVSACKECHAMKPSRRDDVLQGNIVLE